MLRFEVGGLRWDGWEFRGWKTNPFGKERGLAKVVFTVHFTVELIHKTM
jgi:hypothetical protein